MKRSYSLLLFFLIIIFNVSITAQIYEPEGINMPGGWNSWTQPPAIPALASAGQVTGGKISVIAKGVRRYHTVIKAAASGGDVIGGNHSFLFTSGPSTNYFQNKWGGTSIILNSVNAMVFNGTDAIINITNGKWYTVNFKDAGYKNSEAAFLETSAEPVKILYAYDDYKAAGNALHVSIRLNSSKSPEEKVMVRYTTDNWTTSAFTEAIGGGTSYFATIPGNSVTGLAGNEYYVLTSTVSGLNDSNADILTLNYEDNNGANYKIFSKYLTIKADNIQSENPFGPWMFTVIANGVAPEWSLTYVPMCSYQDKRPVYAYTAMNWQLNDGTHNTQFLCNPLPGANCSGATGSGVKTTTMCTEEQTNVLSNSADVTLVMGDAILSGFQHINIVNPNSNWNVLGQAGDQRVYAGTSGVLKVNFTTKLAFSNYRFTLKVPYYAPAGPGGNIIGSGWAQIDPSASDPRWVAEFDPFGTGQVEFEMTSFSAVVQDCYGTYNTEFKIKPVAVANRQSTGIVPQEGSSVNLTVNLPNSGASFNFVKSSFGGNNGNRIFANQIMTKPEGSLPAGIDAVSTLYWNLSTSLDTFSVNITFDLAEVAGISTPANLRILRRVNSSADWTVWGDITLLDPTHLRANNLQSLGEFAIGSTGGNALPVELSSFKAAFSNGKVVLQWTTSTENSNLGFTVERKSSLGNEWQKIGFVKGAGNSISPLNYSYTDNLLGFTGRYLYRLRQENIDGSYNYSYEVEVEVEKPSIYALSQNYPNPFNPSTVIKYSLAEKNQVSIVLFDLLGREVRTLVNEIKDAGSYEVSFNAVDLPSGMYLYRMQSGDFQEIRKMMLLR